MTEYSELAQSTAKDILTQEPGDYRAVLLSVLPFAEADDLPGGNLVVSAWLRIGTDLNALIRFARDHKSDEGITPVLTYLRDALNPVEGKSKYDMGAEDEQARVWLDENS